LKKGDLVKQNICAKAIELFATYGYHSTSFQMIADAVGIKQTNVLYHFKDKQKLFLGVLEVILMSNYAMVSANIKANMNAKERLVSHMKSNLEWAIKSKNEAQVILLLYYFATFEKTFEQIYQKVLMNGRQRIYELVLAGIREGLFQEEDAKEHSEIIHDMLLASVIPFVSRTEKVPAKMKKQTFAKWDKYLDLISL
jgi:AcrR family transcriptional regulator